MNTLLLLPDLFGATGGIQTFNRSLVRAIDQISAEKGSKVSILVLNDRQEIQTPNGYYDDVTTRYRGFGRNKLAFFSTALLEAPAASIVIVGHVNFAALIPAMRARNPKLRFLVTVFGIDVWTRLSRLQQYGLRRVNRIVSISRSTLDRMKAVNELNGTPADILPCTLEPFYGHDVILESREALGLPAGPMVLSTTRLDAAERYKGIDVSLLAMKSVFERNPEAFYVVIGDGSDRHRLEEFASELGITDRVYFKGRVEDHLLPSFYSTSDLFVLASTGEGFGIVFLEAMFYGKCCIGARAGATPEVIEDGVTGLLVEPKKPEVLADGIHSLLTDSEKRARMGSAGQARLALKFSPGLFAKRWESILANASST